MKKNMICYPFMNGDMLDWSGVILQDHEIERAYNGEEVTTTDRSGRITVWKPNGQFEMTLSYNGYGRGQSSTKFYWIDQYGHQFPMFVVDFDSLFRRGGGAIIHGIFTYQKRGQNFGIRLVKLLDLADDDDNDDWAIKACIAMGR